LFRYAYGDCEYGCRHQEYYYFRFNDAEPILVGRWNPADMSPPAWWGEAMDGWIECGCLPHSPQTRLEAQGTREKYGN
jgi:hypothetical protein